jgi:2-iminobutanoate/2-iminopropanoate deaminase
MKSVFLFLCCFILMSFQSCENSNSEIIFHKSHEPSRLNVPYSDAVETKDLLFLTGQIGKDLKTGKLVSGGIEIEENQVIGNIQDVLVYHNLSLDNVVKCTVILKDI